jgi:hypothetical protein
VMGDARWQPAWRGACSQKSRPRWSAVALHGEPHGTLHTPPSQQLGGTCSAAPAATAQNVAVERQHQLLQVLRLLVHLSGPDQRRTPCHRPGRHPAPTGQQRGTHTRPSEIRELLRHDVYCRPAGGQRTSPVPLSIAARVGSQRGLQLLTLVALRCFAHYQARLPSTVALKHPSLIFAC